MSCFISRQRVSLYFSILQRHDRATALQTLREELLRSLQSFVQMAADDPLPDRCAVDASALLRLYCALKVLLFITIIW